MRVCTSVCSRRSIKCLLFFSLLHFHRVASASSCVRGCESMLGCYTVLRRGTVVASSCCRLLCVMQTAVGCWYLAFCVHFSKVGRVLIALVPDSNWFNENIDIDNFRSFAGRSAQNTALRRPYSRALTRPVRRATRP